MKKLKHIVISEFANDSFEGQSFIVDMINDFFEQLKKRGMVQEYSTKTEVDVQKEDTKGV